MAAFDVPVTLPDGREFSIPVDGVTTPEEAAAAVQGAIERNELEFPLPPPTEEVLQKTPEDVSRAPELPPAETSQEEEPQLSEGIMSLSGDVQAVSPRARAEVPPPGVDPEEWDALSFNQRIAIKNEETNARQDLWRQQNPQLAPQRDASGVAIYGESLARQRRRPNVHAEREDAIRSRGIETRESGRQGGATIALLNIAGVPPSVADRSDEEQANALLDWRGKMRVALAESLRIDYGIGSDEDIPVEFDDESGEWVFFNPDNGKWSLVQAQGMNTEDWAALVKDPQQAAVLAGEIALSTGLAFLTGGTSLIASEAAVGAVGAAASQYIRNQRAQELGFEVGDFDGLASQAAVGGAFGAAGGSLAAVAARRAATKAASKVTADEGADVVSSEQLLTAERELPTFRRKQRLAEQAEAQEVAQKEIDESLAGLEEVRGTTAAQADTAQQLDDAQVLETRLRVRGDAAEADEVGIKVTELKKRLADMEDVLPTVRATAGPNRPGSTTLQARSAGNLRKAIEDTLHRPYGGGTDGLRNALDKIADREIEMLKAQERRLRAVRETAARDLPADAVPPSTRFDPAIAAMVSLSDRLGLRQLPADAPAERILAAMRKNVDVEVEGTSAAERLSARNNAVETGRKVMRDRDTAVAEHASRVQLERARFKLEQAEVQRDRELIQQAREDVAKHKPLHDKIAEVESLEQARALLDPTSENALTAGDLVDAIFRPERSQLSPRDQALIDRTLDKILDVRRHDAELQSVGLPPVGTEMLNELRSAMSGEIASRIRVAMKESPERGVGEISSILENKRLVRNLGKIFGKGYTNGLAKLRTGIRKHGLPSKETASAVTVTRAAKTPIRSALRRLTDTFGIVSIAAALASGAYLPIVVGAATGGLGRAVFRTSARITDEAATEAVSRIFSRPDLLKQLGTIRGDRVKMATIAPILWEVAKELSVVTGERVAAARLPDGTVIPLTSPDGSPLNSVDGAVEATRVYVKDTEKDIINTITGALK